MIKAATATSMDTKASVYWEQLLLNGSALFYYEIRRPSINYEMEYLKNIHTFCRDILIAFHETKTLYDCNKIGDILVFINKEILVEGNGLLSESGLQKAF